MKRTNGEMKTRYFKPLNEKLFEYGIKHLEFMSEIYGLMSDNFDEYKEHILVGLLGDL